MKYHKIYNFDKMEIFLLIIYLQAIKIQTLVILENCKQFLYKTPTLVFCISIACKQMIRMNAFNNSCCLFIAITIKIILYLGLQ